MQNELAIGNVKFYKLDEEKANEINVDERGCLIISFYHPIFV